MPAVNRTPPLPEVNSQVTVRLADDETEFPTRVEDVGPDQLALATPSVGLGFVDVLEQDNRLFVTWTVATGRREFPARLLRSETSPVPMWYVAPTGPTVAIQRRRFARVQTSGAFEIVLAGEPLPATLLDLSEGGLRCTVRKPVQIERYVPVVARLVVPPPAGGGPGAGHPGRRTTRGPRRRHHLRRPGRARRRDPQVRVRRAAAAAGRGPAGVGRGREPSTTPRRGASRRAAVVRADPVRAVAGRPRGGDGGHAVPARARARVGRTQPARSTRAAVRRDEPAAGGAAAT